MYCALNFVDGTSLWINKNCSAYEVREGIGDLSEHELYKTKIICFNKLHLEYYHITYEFTYTMNDCKMLIMAGFMELRDKIYLTFNTLGVADTSSQLHVVSEVKDHMQKDITSLKEQIDIISNGAENNAVITEEVNASAEELSSLLENINQSCEDMVSMVTKLEDSTSKFKL